MESHHINISHLGGAYAIHSAFRAESKTAEKREKIALSKYKNGKGI